VQPPSIILAVEGLTVTVLKSLLAVTVIGKLGPNQSQFVIMVKVLTLARILMAHFMQQA
jgi:hypothetical protein